MGLRPGAYAKIWKIEDKGNYHIADMNISKKQPDGTYKKDWGNKFVHLVGTAHQQIKEMTIPAVVKVDSFEVTNEYNNEKQKEFTYYSIFSFSNDSSKTPTPPIIREPEIEESDEDRLPFG